MHQLYQCRYAATTWRPLLRATKKHSQLLFTQLPRRGQPVEKVVVGSVGSPKHPRTQAKTLQNRGFKPLNRGQKRARGSFSTGWGVLGSPFPRSCMGFAPDSAMARLERMIGKAGATTSCGGEYRYEQVNTGVRLVAPYLTRVRTLSPVAVGCSKKPQPDIRGLCGAACLSCKTAVFWSGPEGT